MITWTNDMSRRTTFSDKFCFFNIAHDYNPVNNENNYWLLTTTIGFSYTTILSKKLELIKKLRFLSCKIKLGGFLG